MQRVGWVIMVLVLSACTAEPDDQSLVNKLTQGEDIGHWKLESRWIDGELEKGGRGLSMAVASDGSLNINGHETTYKLHDETYMEFSYEYEEVHDYYVTILHISDTALIYELRNCEFQTVKEKLIPDDD